MPDPDMKPSRFVIPLENVVSTFVIIVILSVVTCLTLLWLR